MSKSSSTSLAERSVVHVRVPSLNLLPPASVGQLKRYADPGLRSIPRSGNYFDGYQVQQALPNSVHITRNYVPMWAAVVAVAFFWCLGLGLLALLLRETEVLTVTATGDNGKTRLNVSGIATFAVAQAVTSAYGRFSPGEATPL